MIRFLNIVVVILAAKVTASSIEWITARGAPSSGWYCSAMSNDGLRGIAGRNSGGYIYKTTEFGDVWTMVDSLGQYIYANGVAMGDDAQHAIVVGNSNAGAKIWVSNDYLNTWNEGNGPPTSIIMQAVAMSGNGRFAVAVENGGKVWRSTNYGADFSITSSPMLGWTAIKMSGSGQIVVATSEYTGIYYSHDYGETWARSNAPSGIWANALAMNVEGNITIAGLGTGGAIYISSDFGVTWTASANSVPSYWHTIACDATGQYIMAAGDGTAMYLSANYGQTWVASGDEDYDWQGLALSNTAVYVVVFRADKLEDGTYSTSSILVAGNPFIGITETDDNTGGGGGNDSATPSPDIQLMAIVIPCSVGGMALLLLVYFYYCMPRVRSAATLSSASAPAYAPVQTTPSAPPQLLLPVRDVQMVMLSTTGARPVSAVGDGSKGAVGIGQAVASGGVRGESGLLDVEIGVYGGGEGEGYDGYTVVAVAVPVTQEDASRMIGASAPPLVEAISK